MATHVLALNTSVSALSLGDGDTVDLAGYTLTLDVDPAAVNVSVGSPGTSGKIVLGSPDSYTLDGWGLSAGEGVLVNTIPEGKSVGGLWIGGEGTGDECIGINDGEVYACRGGYANGAYGVRINNGVITHCDGGLASGSHGCSVNNRLIVRSRGGESGAVGAYVNNGTLVYCDGGDGANAYGCRDNYGTILSLTDSADAVAVLVQRMPVIVTRGPALSTTLPSTIKTLYHIGPLGSDAVVDAGTQTVFIPESDGGGGSDSSLAAARRWIRLGNLGVRA